MAGAQDVNLKDYFKNFKEKLLVKMPKQEEADITSATRLLEVRSRPSNFAKFRPKSDHFLCVLGAT